MSPAAAVREIDFQFRLRGWEEVGRGGVTVHNKLFNNQCAHGPIIRIGGRSGYAKRNRRELVSDNDDSGAIAFEE